MAQNVRNKKVIEYYRAQRQHLEHQAMQGDRSALQALMHIAQKYPEVAQVDKSILGSKGVPAEGVRPVPLQNDPVAMGPLAMAGGGVIMNLLRALGGAGAAGAGGAAAGGALDAGGSAMDVAAGPRALPGGGGGPPALPGGGGGPPMLPGGGGPPALSGGGPQAALMQSLQGGAPALPSGTGMSSSSLLQSMERDLGSPKSRIVQKATPKRMQSKSTESKPPAKRTPSKPPAKQTSAKPSAKSPPKPPATRATSAFKGAKASAKSEPVEKAKPRGKKK